MGPRLSAFCDGEAAVEEQAQMREHLRACAHCRATLRAYRAAPAAAAALAPALPLDRSLFERAHDAVAAVATRFGGGGATDSALSQVAAAGGTRGAGMTALAKVLAICAGTVGGAAACAATGVVPAPLAFDSGREEPQIERQVEQDGAAGNPQAGVDYEPEAPALEAPPSAEQAPEKKPDPEPEPAPAAPAASSGAVEYAPPPAPVSPPPRAATNSSDGSASGEFGP
jgi:hypothetical protein